MCHPLVQTVFQESCLLLIFLSSTLCSLHPTNLDIGVLSCFFHKVSSAFTFKKGKEESCIYLGHSDPSPDTTLPSWVRFAWSFIHLYSHWFILSLNNINGGHTSWLVLGWAVCMHKSMQHHWCCQMGGDFPWMLLESVLGGPCSLQHIIGNTATLFKSIANTLNN